MNLPFHIAGRYLFARKSHNVINIISAISAAGMAIGTAALILILSVYNGFDKIVESSLSDVDPDILVTPAQGKLFEPDSAAFAWAYDQDEIYTMYGVLQDRVFLTYDGRQSIAIAKGIDEEHSLDTPLRKHLKRGEFQLQHGQLDNCILGEELARNLGVNVNYVTRLQVHYPIRDRKISVIDPYSSLNSADVKPVGTIAVNASSDAQLVVLPYRTMEKLLGAGNKVTGVEIRLREGCGEKDLERIKEGLKSRLGSGCRVRDRVEQNESVYRMMTYEKASTYLILLFIVIIIAFNIFGSLSMLIIEKKEDIGTLYALGASKSMVRRVFVLEGWMVSLAGMAVGLVAGLLLAWIQMRFGIVSMPGNFMVSAYPVSIQFGDVFLTAAGVTIVGYIVALLPVLGRMDYE